MEIKHVIPDMTKTFGNLEYAGEGRVEMRRINGRQQVAYRVYNLYSDVQRADDVCVYLPAAAGEKHFEVEDPVKLLNPRIVATGRKIGDRGFTDYKLYADNMIKKMD